MTTKRGHAYILTINDTFSKYVVAVPLKNKLAPSISSAFHSNWILLFGPPLRMHSDQGLCFESAQFKNLLSSCGLFNIFALHKPPSM